MLKCRPLMYPLLVSMITPFIPGTAMAAAYNWNMTDGGAAKVLIHVQ
ncbi:hypothetical protein FHS16_003700 [Paenibacillus endophyticus]|uniref:Uncharacterized protein n=1 Tax=Paenibacillus endophyticus TaxID=1294268 RepID=A0A7W5GBB0_9BACL|nr:hypothetical protein [Paenibacillus endophyticus]MBB3153625.1 hypothetical protein [Paenibacillus endophyticus]